MRTSTIALLISLALTGCLTACVKDTEDLAQDLGVIPNGCGSDGARFQATVDGNSYCASAQVIATGEGFSVTVTGVDLTGNTLVLQEMTEASNGLLYMESGTTYVMLPGNTGTLTITEADTTAHILKATFDAILHNDASGDARHLAASLDVVYTVE
jgi:hypothetical protein